MVKSLKAKLAKLLSTHDFSSSFPTKLKELPSKFLELSGEVNELKKLVNELEVELPTKLKEIPLKLEDFTKTVTSLTSQVADLKTLMWELPEEFLSIPTNVANVFKNASQRAGETSIPSAGEADTVPVEGGEQEINAQKKIAKDAKAKAAKLEGEKRKEELVDILGQLHETERELGIDLDKPLDEQDPLNRLNDLVRNKRRHANDIHDYFKANKMLESSLQYEDHLAGTVLNAHVLGMIMFNSFKRQDFVTIEDFKYFDNTMMYIVQEIFFRRQKGPGLDDHARTLSSLLLVKIDRRNVNPLKQIRETEQLRH
nr:hypothetical protein [Tanacetum cinerariifolium]